MRERGLVAPLSCVRLFFVVVEHSKNRFSGIEGNRWYDADSGGWGAVLSTFRFWQVERTDLSGGMNLFFELSLFYE